MSSMRKTMIVYYGVAAVDFNNHSFCQAGKSAYGQRVGKTAGGSMGRPLSPVMDDDAFVGFLNEAARRIL